MSDFGRFGNHTFQCSALGSIWFLSLSQKNVEWLEQEAHQFCLYHIVRNKNKLTEIRRNMVVDNITSIATRQCTY